MAAKKRTRRQILNELFYICGALDKEAHRLSMVNAKSTRIVFQMHLDTLNLRWIELLATFKK